MNVERIRECIATGPMSKVENMLLAVYANQTADEQATESTNHTNGMGFNGTDAGFLSSLAKQVIAYRETPVQARRYASALSVKQESALRKALRKYAGQIAASIPAPAPVAVAVAVDASDDDDRYTPDVVGNAEAADMAAFIRANGPPPGVPADDATMALFTPETAKAAAFAFGKALMRNEREGIAIVHASVGKPVAFAEIDALLEATDAVLEAKATERNAAGGTGNTPLAGEREERASAVADRMLADKKLAEHIGGVAYEQYQNGQRDTEAQRAYSLWRTRKAPVKVNARFRKMASI